MEERQLYPLKRNNPPHSSLFCRKLYKSLLNLFFYMFSLLSLSSRTRQFADAYQDEFNRRVTKYLQTEQRLSDDDITIEYVEKEKYSFKEIVPVEDLSFIFGRTPQTIQKRIQNFANDLVYKDSAYYLSPFAACFFYPPQQEFYSRASYIPREEVLEELLLSSEKDLELVKLVTHDSSYVVGSSFFNMYDALHQRWAMAMEDEEQRKNLLQYNTPKPNGIKRTNGKIEIPLTSEQKEMVTQLMNSCENLMYSIIHKMGIHPKDYRWNTAESAGRLGLFEAARRYDPSKTNKFSSYAVHYIRGFIWHDLIKNRNMVPIGTSQVQRTLFYQLPKWQQGKIKGLPEDASLEDAAKHFNVSVESIKMMQQRLAWDVSLDAKLYNGSDGSEDTLADRLPSHSPTPEESITSSAQLAKNLTLGVRDILDKREQYIIEHHIMPDEEDKETLEEIGHHFGITRERTRQIEARALQKMKLKMSELHPDVNEGNLDLDN